MKLIFNLGNTFVLLLTIKWPSDQEAWKDMTASVGHHYKDFDPNGMVPTGEPLEKGPVYIDVVNWKKALKLYKL